MLGMISLLDDSIGNLTDTLEEKGLLHDTLIFFMSDVKTKLQILLYNFIFRLNSLKKKEWWRTTR